MKNKSLIFSYFLLFGFLVSMYGYGMGVKQTKASSSEQTTTHKTVGILQYVSHPALDTIKEGVIEGLKKGGYTEGDNLTIRFQNGQADQSKLATMSEQLVNNKADVLVGIATPAAQALANTTSTIPIVLGAVTDPVSAKLVTSLKEPGGNITGVSDKAPINAQFELAQTLLPKAKTVGILYSSAEDNSKYQVEEATKIAEALGYTVKKYAVPSTNEISQTVQVMSETVDFIYVPLDNTIANAMASVVAQANKTKTPIIPSVDTMVEQGGLATVGINQKELGIKTGEMVAAILNGKSNPATTPVYTFSSGDIIVNTKQAEILGITIPDDILEKATNEMKKLSKGIAGLAFFLALGIGGYLVGLQQGTSKVATITTSTQKHYTIGILQYISHPSLDKIKKGIIDGLDKEGYTDGKNATITFLNGQGDQSKLKTMSQQLVSENPDVLIPIATPAAKAIANETTTIPIVAGAISDPVGSGLVTSVTEPTGNITGVQNKAPITDQIKLLKELLPDAKTIGVIYSANEENSKSYVKAITEKGTEAGYEIKSYAIQSSNDLTQTVQVMSQETDVIYVPQDNGIASAFQTLMNEANKAKKPVFVSVDNMVEEGGLATVGQDQYQLGIRTAKLVAKVLKQTSKTTLPFDVVSTGNVIVNEEKAKELGITIPEDVLKDATIVGGD